MMTFQTNAPITPLRQRMQRPIAAIGNRDSTRRSLTPRGLVRHQSFLYCSPHQNQRGFIVIKGSCCCGAVKFELLTAPSMMGTCHCSRCRKVGASTIVFVKREDLKWHQGKEHVALYKPTPPHKYGRCFCEFCGTSLGEILSEDATFPIAANALDTDIGLRNQFHEFTSNKPNWYEICDDSPQSASHPSS